MTSETTEVLFARYGERYRWMVSLACMLGLVSTQLSTTIVNVAIPDIMGSFGIGQDRAQWLSTGALAAMTVSMLTNAWLIRAFGPRKIFVGSLSLFTVASIAAGLSPNDSLLIACRIVQGAVAGLLQPLTMFVMFSVFPPERRGLAMGLFGLNIIIGPVLGPLIGGTIIEHFDWRHIFYVPIPVTIIAIVFGSVLLPEREAPGSYPRFDWTGLGLLILSLASFLIALANGQREGWHSNYTLTHFAIALTGLTAFIAWELKVAEPLVKLRLFANAKFAAAASVGYIMGAGLFGSFYLIPLFVQTVQGYTPLVSGLLLIPAGLALAVIFPIAGRLTDILPPQWLIMTGLLSFALSTYLTGHIDVNTPFWTLAGWIMLGRIGLGLINPPLSVASVRPLKPSDLGQAAGLINFSRQLGGACGVSALSAVLEQRLAFHSSWISSTQNSGNSATADLLRGMQSLLAQGGASPDLQTSGALHYLGRVVYAQASTLAFRDSFLAVTVVFVLALVPAWIMGSKGRAHTPVVPSPIIDT